MIGDQEPMETSNTTAIRPMDHGNDVLIYNEKLEGGCHERRAANALSEGMLFDRRGYSFRVEVIWKTKWRDHSRKWNALFLERELCRVSEGESD
mmetsp:Transcript_14238/g.34572  ORF Transcript_14238/g.34572 Transcript_14238/m.34572 type:complete len:94 (-) Transcript_14238:214-495(-)